MPAAPVGIVRYSDTFEGTTTMTSQGLALDSRSVPIASAARGRYFVDPGQLYLAIVKSSDDAIITKTLDGTITSWNAAAEKLFGYTAEEAVGEKIDIIVPPEQRDQVRLILQKIGAGERFEHFETVRVTKDGRKLDISLSVSPVKAPDGTIVGAAKVARDVTLEKQIQRELTPVRTGWPES